MEDTDLIACVYQNDNIHGNESEAIEASSRYMPPRLHAPKKKGRRERGSTEPTENSGASSYDYLPRLEIRFSNIPKTDHGLVFGSNPNSDVVLDHDGVSNCHFSITFDEVNRPIVQDWNSTRGTEVTYNQQGRGLRRNFRWIIGGARFPQQMNLVIAATKTISFRIVVAHHDIASQAYIDKVTRFRRGRASTEELFGQLGLPRDTKLHSKAETPGTGAIYLKKKLGEGSFGVVVHHWNVSDGSEFALKEPTTKAIRERRVDVEAWRREARIMRQLSHPNIVRLFESPPTLHCELRLEYAPCGSLSDQEHVSPDETQSILIQCLSALIYLHEHQPPIAHRDIKPDNILVQQRSRSGIHVKFGDFGLAKDSYDLMTICGTSRYLAPEVYLEWQRLCSGDQRSTYTTAVDVWSLGVVVLELICDLPPYEAWYKNGGTAWCEQVVAKFRRESQKQPNRLGRFPLNSMLVLSPDLRCTACQCYELSTGTDVGWRTSMVALYSPEDHVAVDPKTANWQRRPSDDAYATVSPYRAGRLIKPEVRPPESVPSASRMARKRAVTSKSSEERGETSKAAGKRAARFKSPEKQAPKSRAVTSKAAGKRAAASDPVSSSSLSSRDAKHRPSRSRREPAPSEPPELARFLEDYSGDPLNSLYVGPSFASWLGVEGPGHGESQYSHGSTLQNQPGHADAQEDPGSRSVLVPSRPSAPWSRGDSRRSESGGPVVGGRFSASGLDSGRREAQAAELLRRAMARDC